jgi:predicted acyltransferase
MIKSEQSTILVPLQRITSVDFFRGFTMFLLIGKSTGFFGCINEVNNGFFKFLGEQLEHHEWHGLHFWDLIQNLTGSSNRHNNR